MEVISEDGVKKGWAGKWLKVDLSYKVWKVKISKPGLVVVSNPLL